MKLGFLANTARLNARNRSLPVHQAEAVVVYGTNVQKAKILKKLKSSAAALPSPSRATLLWSRCSATATR